jgi:hypothetical protein
MKGKPAIIGFCCGGFIIPVTWMMENTKTSVKKIQMKILILRNYRCKSAYSKQSRQGRPEPLNPA